MAKIQSFIYIRTYVMPLRNLNIPFDRAHRVLSGTKCFIFGTCSWMNCSVEDSNLLPTSFTCCGQLITLIIKVRKIQLSNFQKHLRSSNWSHMKAIKKMNEDQRKTSVQHSNDISSSPTSIQHSHKFSFLLYPVHHHPQVVRLQIRKP
jgi:hypothetical protein